MTAEAQAQSTSTFRGAQPFPGTVRDLLRDDLAKTSGQLHGAIGTMERRGVLHLQPGETVAVAETNIIAGALRIFCNTGVTAGPDADKLVSLTLDALVSRQDPAPFSMTLKGFASNVSCAGSCP